VYVLSLAEHEPASAVYVPFLANDSLVLEFHSRYVSLYKMSLKKVLFAICSVLIAHADVIRERITADAKNSLLIPIPCIFASADSHHGKP
jgi:hypothetical protein